MTTSIRTKIVRFFLATAVITIFISGPLSTPSAYASDCPTVGQDCTGG